jgi:4-azaleucine resistance transporter AzlC
MTESIEFTRTGALAGARRSLPLAASVFAYGTVFGVLARQAGLTSTEAVLMSGLVVAGAAQFVAVGLWATPVPIAGIVLSTLVINLRHLLMGAALSPWFARLPAAKAYGSVFFLSDESWALTMRDAAAGGRDRAFLLGCGLPLTAAWIGSTAVGHLAGALLPDPTRWGFDFAFTAAFVALLVGMWRGKGDVAPWAVAAVVAVATATWLPGTWHVLLGGLAGSLVGGWRGER